MVRTFTVLILCMLLSRLASVAQPPGLLCSFVADTVNTGYGQTFANKIKIQNNGSHTINLLRGSITEDNLLQLPDTLVVNPGSVRIIPVKFVAVADLFSGAGVKPITASYTNAADGSVIKAVFMVKINQTDQVMVGASESLTYINPANAFTPIRVRCYNKGYTPATINLKITVNPAGLFINNPVRQVMLKPGEERIIELEARLVPGERNLVEYNALIEATNKQGLQISSTLVHLTVLQNASRQNPTGLLYANTLKNAFDVSYVNLNNMFTYYQTRVNGDIALSPSATLSYLGNITYYDRTQQYEAYDSWVSVHSNRFQLKAGNIMENLDHPVYGRGLKTSLGITRHSTISYYYVQNSYNLFSTVQNSVNNRGSMMAASWDYNRNGYLHRTSVLNGTNQFTGAHLSMINNETLLPIGAKQRIAFKGGYSYEQRNGNGKSGFAGGAVYTYRSKNFNVNLNNYYSSPYYGGLQRGSAILDNQASYYLNAKTSVFAHYALLNNKPQYLTDSLNTYGLYNNTTRYELGVERRIGRLNLSLHPYLLQQNTKQSNQAAQLHTSSSARLGTDLNYTLKGGRQLFLLSDIGYTRSFDGSELKNNYLGVKVNASYLQSWWGVNTFFQRAPYYLSEEVLLAQSSGNYYSYAIGPNLHLTGMHQKLNIAVNPYVSFASYSLGQNHSLNAQATYKLKGSWQLSGDVFFTSINGATSNLRSRVGISKQFTRTTLPGSKNLELTLFNDANNDGILNSDETPLEGLIVTLRNSSDNNTTDLTTISSSQGTVSYSNLKEGNYDVMISRGNGLHLAENTAINLQKSKKLTLPMVKSLWLKGKVVPVQQEYATSRPLLEGLRITAMNADNKAYSTLTNEEGEFEFSLPASTYHVSVTLNGQKFLIKNQNQEVKVNASLEKQLEFQLIDETRKIIVRQF
jgi:hypothetical protein